MSTPSERTHTKRAMKTPKFELSDDVMKAVYALGSELNEALGVLRARYDRQPQWWTDIDEAVTISAWLEELDDLAGTLEDFDQRPRITEEES